MEAINQVRQRSQSQGARRWVLLAVASYARADDSLSWPSDREIRAETTLSRSAVQKALRHLQKTGELVRVHPAGMEGRRVFRVRPGAPQLSLDAMFDAGAECVPQAGECVPEAAGGVYLRPSGVYVGLAREGTGLTSTTEPAEPAPHDAPQMGSNQIGINFRSRSERAAWAKSRRRRRRRDRPTGEAPPLPASTGCSACGLTDREAQALRSEWATIESRLLELLSDRRAQLRWQMWRAEAQLHLHPVEDGQHVALAATFAGAYVEQLFGGLLATAACKPVRIIACQGEAR